MDDTPKFELRDWLAPPVPVPVPLPIFVVMAVAVAAAFH
jgi:hypothetical protein